MKLYTTHQDLRSMGEPKLFIEAKNDVFALRWLALLLGCTLLGACFAPGDAEHGSDGWALDAGLTCGATPSDASNPGATDTGRVDHSAPGERVCGEPLDRLEGWFEQYEQLTALEEQTCDVYRGSILLTATELADLSIMPPLRVIEGKLQIRGGNVLESVDGLERLEYVGNLSLIGMPALDDLSALSNLREVAGYFIIRHSSGPTHLRGLENLRSAGMLEIDDNDGLQSLEGLDGLEMVEGRFEIEANDALEHLSGLSKLEHVGTLSIQSNDNLKDLDGLENLQSVGRLTIADNPNLESLDGLAGLKCVRGDLIVGGVALPQEEVQALLDRVDVGGEVQTYSSSTVLESSR